MSNAIHTVQHPKYRIEELLNDSENKYELMREIIKKLGIHRDTLHRWRRIPKGSEKDIKHEQLKKIAAVFNVSIDSLYNAERQAA